MALKDTINEIKRLLDALTRDVAKAENGNKAASQRVRTGSIRLEKVAKKYRKESIAAEKQGTFKKKTKVAPKAAKKPMKRPMVKAAKKPMKKAKRR